MNRRHSRLWAFFVIALLFSGCMSKPDYFPPEQPLQAPTPPRAKPSIGSIWPGESSANMLFCDKKAGYINDIVTILISESSLGTNKATTNTSRDSSASAGIDAFLGLDHSILSRNAGMGSKIEIGGSAVSNLKGEGNTSRGGQLVATLSARVTRVLDNGNLVIEGKRQLSVNNEDQYIILTGIIRPEDIRSDNSIYSQYIADARMVYTGQGVINDKMKPGWMTRVVDWVWPF
ncbi:MAG: flagellar basal body L-ring protein FlgH [Syntrophus sp. (in: bacteria)]|nr:flagellar basal body L-ring protein FlgH [Syntrophus sp. (in: bacteria)]